jgi:hypothetical protein
MSSATLAGARDGAGCAAGTGMIGTRNSVLCSPEMAGSSEILMCRLVRRGEGADILSLSSLISRVTSSISMSPDSRSSEDRSIESSSGLSSVVFLGLGVETSLPAFSCYSYLLYVDPL